MTDEKALHQRVSDLQDEVAYLRSELGLSIRSSQIKALADLGMGVHHARALLTLRSAKGRVLSVFQIGDGANLTPLSAKITICQCRRWVPGIENQRGEGYALNTAGQAFVDQVLRDVPLGEERQRSDKGER